MANKNYHPEPYWTKVAERIQNREGKNIIAGDDEPYYRYKRNRFLEMMSSIDFQNKSVLEIGSGPGGNLEFISKKEPSRLVGVDISQSMVDLSKNHLLNLPIDIHKIDGTSLPFSDGEFDICFSATVLQHNTDEKMMESVLKEMCRVSSGKVILFERINNPIAGDELCLGRPVQHYEKICTENGFKLVEVEFINIFTSYLVAGFTRKVLNPSDREEGEPLTGFSVGIQNALLPFTKFFDKIFKVKKDLGKLVFEKAD